MIRKHEILLVAPMLILAMSPAMSPGAEEAMPAAAKWVPSQAIVVLNVSNPKAVWDLFLQPRVIEAVESSPAYRAAAAKPGFRQFEAVVKLFERRLNSDWKTIVHKLTGGGMTWAVGPGGGSLLIVDSLDAEVPKSLHDFMQFMVESDAEKKGQTDRVRSVKHGGVTIWSFGPRQAHALIGKRWMVANRPEVIKAALDMRGRSGGKSMASLPAYGQAMKAAGADAAAALYVNTGVLKKLPKVAAALSSEKNPLLALLAGPLTEALGKSSWLSLSLKIKGDALSIDAISDGAVAAGGVAKFALAAKGGYAAAPNLVVPRRLAAMSLYRDLAGFYAAKDKLFPERTGGLIFFENMMGIFFTGRDLTSEVLAEMGPQVRLVVAEQKYAKSVGTPAAQLPAFALVVPLKNPRRFTPIVEEAWQKAIGLVNFTRGQKALPGLLIDRPVHNGTKYTVAGFTPPTDNGNKPVDIRFNFRPAIAVSNGHLILSSTGALAEDVMDALVKEADTPAKPTAPHSSLVIDGAQVASILGANRENMVRGNMVDKGSTRQQAESEIDTLLTVVKHIKRVGLTLGVDKGRSKISLEIHLNLPSAGKGGK